MAISLEQHHFVVANVEGIVRLTAHSDWEDYGAGCWTGNKICCCAKYKKSSN